MHSLIQKYCFNNNQKLYGCFVDFKKAFDTIPRGLLFEKLLNHGIKGKFFNVLKTMYTNDSVCVGVGGKITESFIVNQGVRQGCVLSPLLFNIFLSDLPELLLNAGCCPAKLTNSNVIGCIVWADDILMLSETKDGLQNMLHILGEYSSKNFMDINYTKTKGIIFNKTGKIIKTAYKLKDAFIYSTNSYKYLGLMITPSGALIHGLADLKDRAMRAYYKLKQKLGHLFRRHINITIHLYNTLVRPILLYASDYWGCLKMPTNNPIETAHMRFCKDLLGVQKQTTNLGVLLELGEIPLTVLARNNCIRNFSRITVIKQANTLLTTLAQDIPTNNSWFHTTQHSLDVTGIGKNNDSICKHLLQRLSDVFYQEAQQDLNRESSKLRTYKEIKINVGRERYLTHPMSVEVRITFTKLRLSNHSLMIEVGRHRKVDVAERWCPFCLNRIETEKHFLLQCKLYTSIREELFRGVLLIFPTFSTLLENEKFFILMSHAECIPHTALFTHKAFEIRSFLINSPKNHS